MKFSKNPNSSAIIVIVLVSAIALDAFVWHGVFFAPSSSVTHDYFLDVGQGDAELVVFPGNVKVMTDAGPTDAVLADLAKILPQGDDHIDLAIISSPEPDHANGYNFILDHYSVGAFIYNGRDDDPPNAAWSGLLAKITSKNVPLVTLGRGDEIHYRGDTGNRDDYEIDVLSPGSGFDESAALADASLVELVKTPEFKTLIMSGAGANVGDWLAAQGDDVRADVLEIGDQGLAYSTPESFLRAINPAALITKVVNAKNADGHVAAPSFSLPSLRLASSTSALILTTAQNGTIEIYPEDGKLKVIKEK